MLFVRTSVALLLLGAWLTAAHCHADDAATAEAPLEPVARTARDIALSALRETDDPAFEQYVSAECLEAAFHWADAGQLADCALQLAQGEKILLREHAAGIAPRTAMEVAGEWVANFGSKKDLVRLEKVSMSLGFDNLTAQFNAAQQTAGASRGPSTKNSYRRVRFAKVDGNRYQRLQKHPVFRQIFSFQSKGRIVPNYGFALYYNSENRNLLTFDLVVSNPPEYITMAERSAPGPDGYDTIYRTCDCSGTQSPTQIAEDLSARRDREERRADRRHRRWERSDDCSMIPQATGGWHCGGSCGCTVKTVREHNTQ